MKYRLPTTVSQKDLAMVSPLRFVVREFFRLAAGLALALAVVAVISPSVFEGHPRKRIYFITFWALFMSLWQLWKARRKNTPRTRAGNHVSGSAI